VEAFDASAAVSGLLVSGFHEVTGSACASVTTAGAGPIVLLVLLVLLVHGAVGALAGVGAREQPRKPAPSTQTAT
jgi:hypothetical protein